MLRIFLRTIVINFASVYLTFLFLGGTVTFYGGVWSLLIAIFLISLANIIVKPLINLFLLPLHLITLGFFRWVSNLIILYLVTLIFTGFKIHGFVSPRFDLTYLIIPSIHFSVFGAFIVVALTLTAIFHFLYWLFQD